MRRWWTTRWFPALLLCVATIAVWWPALGNDFAFDDVIHVLLNERVRHLSTAWQTFVHPYHWSADVESSSRLQPYRPLETVLYVLNYALWGPRPFGHYLTRLVEHVAVSLLLFLFLCRRLRSIGLAFAVALVAALHPAVSETMHAPSDLLVALFGLGALLVATRQRPRPWDAAPMALLLLLALLSKESGILYVPLALAFVWLARGETDPPRPSSSVWPVAAASAVALAVYLVFRLHALGGSAVSAGAGVGSLAQAVTGVWYFATQAFFLPLDRAPAILDFAVTPRTDQALWYAITAAYALALAVLVARRRWLAVVGLLWWLGSLAPSAAVTLAPAAWPGLYRWLYMGTPGLLLALADTLQRSPLPARRPRALQVAWALVCIAFATLSIRATRVWKSDVTLFSAMVLEQPEHYWGYRRLGWALYYRSRFAEAVPVLARGAELAPPDERDSCYGLQAGAMAGADDCTGALALYRAHVPTPMMAPDHFALVEAACLERKNEVPGALRLYHACAAKDPRCRAAEERLTRDPAARSSEKPL
jgi:hypothetical protein